MELRPTASRLLFVATSVVLLLGADAVHAQTLSRGPYLQNGNTSAISIRWRTSSNTDSVVRYGTSQSNLNLSVTNATAKTEHELRITGLGRTPSTTTR